MKFEHLNNVTWHLKSTEFVCMQVFYKVSGYSKYRNLLNKHLSKNGKRGRAH